MGGELITLNRENQSKKDEYIQPSSKKLIFRGKLNDNYEGISEGVWGNGLGEHLVESRSKTRSLVNTASMWEIFQ